MRYICPQQLSKLLNVPFVCLYMQMSAGLSLTDTPNATNRSSASGDTKIELAQTGQRGAKDAFDEMSKSYPLGNMKTYFRSNSSVLLEPDNIKNISTLNLFRLLRAFYNISDELESINKSKFQNDLEEDNIIHSDFEKSEDLTEKSRTKRNEECSNSVRQRSVCPWEYEYSRDDTLLPELIQTISCQSTNSRIHHSLIQCHQLYTYKLFKMRNCEDNSASTCFVRKRVKSGCQATFPCVVPAIG